MALLGRRTWPEPSALSSKASDEGRKRPRFSSNTIQCGQFGHPPPNGSAVRNLRLAFRWLAHRARASTVQDRSQLLRDRRHPGGEVEFLRRRAFPLEIAGDSSTRQHGDL